MCYKCEHECKITHHMIHRVYATDAMLRERYVQWNRRRHFAMYTLHDQNYIWLDMDPSDDSIRLNETTNYDQLITTLWKWSRNEPSVCICLISNAPFVPHQSYSDGAMNGDWRFRMNAMRSAVDSCRKHHSGPYVVYKDVMNDIKTNRNPCE